MSAEKYDLSPALVLAVIEVESGFQENAVSPKRARGLMQIMPSTFKFYCEETGNNGYIFDVRTNVDCGSWYLSYLKNRFGDELSVVAAYNAGEGNVEKWLKDERYSNGGELIRSKIPFSETRKYAAKIALLQKKYQLALFLLLTIDK